MKKYIIALFLSSTIASFGQKTVPFADSIRNANQIPELAYAVISPDSVMEMAFLGHHSVDLPDTAAITDRFHIASMTKAMTGFIAAKYVELHKLKWKTKFFDVFPAWEKGSDPAYAEITLLDLLSHRARIQPFTQEDPSIVFPEFTGNTQEKRQQFGRFALTLSPVDIDPELGYAYSNADYALAAIMVEKVANKSWETMVQDIFNTDLGLDVGFSWPENQTKKDTWGHYAEDGKLIAVPSNDGYKIDLAEPAGDLNITLPNYIRFIQMNMRGLSGENNYLKAKTYRYLHTCLPQYAIGWANITGENLAYSSHSGTVGTYFTIVNIDRINHKAYIIFTNSFSEGTQQGVRLIMRKLKAEYGSPN